MSIKSKTSETSEAMPPARSFAALAGACGDIGLAASRAEELAKLALDVLDDDRADALLSAIERLMVEIEEAAGALQGALLSGGAR